MAVELMRMRAAMVVVGDGDDCRRERRALDDECDEGSEAAMVMIVRLRLVAVNDSMQNQSLNR
jgi:hypothetical protein